LSIINVNAKLPISSVFPVNRNFSLFPLYGENKIKSKKQELRENINRLKRGVGFPRLHLLLISPGGTHVAHLLNRSAITQ